MGKVPVRIKEVVYHLSSFEQSVMSGLWKDLPHKAAHHAANVGLAAVASPGPGAPHLPLNVGCCTCLALADRLCTLPDAG